MMRFTHLVVALLAMFAAVGANPQRVFACSCMPPDSEEEFRRKLVASKYPTPIFAGTVVGLEYPGGDIDRAPRQIATVAVSRIWVGDDRALIQITSPNPYDRTILGNCGAYFSVGREVTVMGTFVTSCAGHVPYPKVVRDVLGEGMVPTNVITDTAAYIDVWRREHAPQSAEVQSPTATIPSSIAIAITIALTMTAIAAISVLAVWFRKRLQK